MPGPYTIITPEGRRFELPDEAAVRLGRDKGDFGPGTLVEGEGGTLPLEQAFELSGWAAPPIMRPLAPPPAPPNPFTNPEEAVGRQPLGSKDALILLGLAFLCGLLVFSVRQGSGHGGTAEALGYGMGMATMLLLVLGAIYVPLRLRYRRGPSAMGCAGILLAGSVGIAMLTAFVQGVRQHNKKTEFARKVVVPVPEMKAFDVDGVVSIHAPGPFTTKPLKMDSPLYEAAWSSSSASPSFSCYVFTYHLKKGAFFMPAKALEGVITHYKGQAAEVVSLMDTHPVVLEGGPAQRAEFSVKIKSNGAITKAVVGLLAFGSPLGEKAPREGVVVLVTSEWGDADRDRKAVDDAVATLARLK